MKQEDSQQNPQSDTSANEKQRETPYRPTFKRVLSDEEFQAVSNRIAEGMVKSLHEAKPD